MTRVALAFRAHRNMRLPAKNEKTANSEDSGTNGGAKTAIFVRGKCGKMFAMSKNNQILGAIFACLDGGTLLSAQTLISALFAFICARDVEMLKIKI